jgi:hypothetical protein
MKKIVAVLAIWSIFVSSIGTALGHCDELTTAYIFLGDRPFLYTSYGKDIGISWQSYERVVDLGFEPVDEYVEARYFTKDEQSKIIGEIHFFAGPYHAKLTSLTLEPDSSEWRISEADQKSIRHRIEDDAKRILDKLSIQSDLLPIVSKMHDRKEQLFVFDGEKLILIADTTIDYLDEMMHPMPIRQRAEQLLRCPLVTTEDGTGWKMEVSIHGTISVVSRLAIIGLKELKLERVSDPESLANFSEWRIPQAEVEKLMQLCAKQELTGELGTIYYQRLPIPKAFFDKLQATSENKK